jgi:hypothetical protein
MSTVELRDAGDDLEHKTAGVRVLLSVPARSGGWLRAEEEEDEDDLYGEDDLGFDEIDEEDDDEDEEVADLDADDDDLDELDEEVDEDEV